MATERVLPSTLEIPFTICDNTVNRYGWRLLVEGINTEGFLSNPVCCVQHDTFSAPVGKWKDLVVKDEKLTGVVEFDRNDEEAVKYYWKYADGYMNAVSLHIVPVETSTDKVMLLAGQTRPTVTKSDLMEISLVTVPGQKNAVKLSHPEGGEYKLSIINIKSTKQMDENQENEGLKLELAKQKELNAKNLVKLHVQRGVVQEEEVEHLNKLASADYETTEKMLDARKVAEVPKTPGTEEKTEAQLLAEKMAGFTDNKGKDANTEKLSWTFLDWYKKDQEGLELMAKNEPEKFKKLEADFVKSGQKEGLVA